MSSLSQASPLGGLLPPHDAFQGHVAHPIEWSMELNSKGSTGTCILVGIAAFLTHTFTANTPTYILYHGRNTGKDKDSRKIWTRIGAVWPNKSGTLNF